MNERILLTGGSGFLGSGVKAALSHANPVLFDRANPETNADVSGVIHIASLVAYHQTDSQALFEGNTLLTQWLCRHYSQKRFVLASSVSVYGTNHTETLITELSKVGTNAPYGLSKLWAEQFVASLESYAIIRFSSLYGPGMNETTLIPRYVQQALATGTIEVWGTGERRQNYLHQSDAVALLLAAMKSVENGIFLGTDVCEYSNLEVAEIIADLTGAQIRFINSDSSKSISYNNLRTRQQLGWEPRMDLRTGLEQYIEWKKRQSL